MRCEGDNYACSSRNFPDRLRDSQQTPSQGQVTVSPQNMQHGTIKSLITNIQQLQVAISDLTLERDKK
jgi:hypothetical protein